MKSLRDKWKELSYTLDEDYQIEFLKDTLELYTNHPNRSLIYYVGALVWVGVMYQAGFALISAFFLVAMMGHLAWLFWKYLQLVRRFEGKWYGKFV